MPPSQVPECPKTQKSRQGRIAAAVSVRGRRLYPRRVLVIRTRLPFLETLGDVSGVSFARYFAGVPASR